MRDLLQITGVEQTDIDDLSENVRNGVSISGLFNTTSEANVGYRPDLRTAGSRLMGSEDAAFCANNLTAPIVSAPSGNLETDNQVVDGDLPVKVGLGYSAESWLPINVGVVDIIYTLDGSEPDCVPRLGNCDTSRVKTVTHYLYWRLGSTINIWPSQLPVTVRARAVAPFSCGIYGPEVVRNYF
jgi:hypothetical protein